MYKHIEFETPENIEVAYDPAGLGTRFLAWLIDMVLFVLLVVALGVLFALVALGFHVADTSLAEAFSMGRGGVSRFTFILYGVFLLASNLGMFLYFGLSEYLYHGTTYGKRKLSLRVVKMDGFSLDGTGIVVRTLFRVIDHMPPLWIVPLLSKRGQRLGDLVGNTLVIQERPATISPLRRRLLARTAAEQTFPFSPATLARVLPEDIEVMEALLNRWNDLRREERKQLSNSILFSLTKRLQVDMPPPEHVIDFMKDLLTAEYRRQYHRLD